MGLGGEPASVGCFGTSPDLDLLGDRMVIHRDHLHLVQFCVLALELHSLEKKGASVVSQGLWVCVGVQI